jgi:hypothetical protein
LSGEQKTGIKAQVKMSLESPLVSTRFSKERPGPKRKHRAKPIGAGRFVLKTIDHLDGRTVASKRAFELIAAIGRDLTGSDDSSQLTEGTKQLIQRAAILGAMIESNEAAWLGGDVVDLSNYFIALNTQRRILVTLGLERRCRDVSPNLEQYLQQQNGGGDVAAE